MAFHQTEAVALHSIIQPITTEPQADTGPHTLIVPLGDLDTYRVGPVWYTIWHREDLAHGTPVEAFRPLGGDALAVGQAVALGTAETQPDRQGRITAIQVIDPAQANGELHRAQPYAAGRRSPQTGQTPTRCWLITVEEA